MKRWTRGCVFSGIFLISLQLVSLQVSYADTQETTVEQGKVDIKIIENSYFTEENINSKDTELFVEKLEKGNDFLQLTGTALPSYYSSVDKGYISAVKNQGGYGTCWAFGTLAAVEANLIMNKKASKSVDLSEAQLAYFAYHQPTLPYSNAHLDKTTLKTTDSYLYVGGNYYMSSIAFAKGIGIANESTMPYSQLSYSSTYNENLAFKSDYVVKNSYFINMGDKDAIKNAVMKYGSVACTLYMNNWYMNFTTNAYNQTETRASNHAVVVVGWDDNYSANNFNTKPSKNGAWLVKNSYGDSWGAGGYMWVSYEEISLPYSLGSVFEADVNDGTYLHRYQYDGTSVYAYACDVYYYSNVYKAVDDEQIHEVAIMTMEDDINYELEIYKNVSKVPTDGTKVYTKKGNLSLEGYHTITIDDYVKVDKGTKFSIVLKTRDKNGNPVNVLIDMTSDFDCTFDYNAVSNLGESFNSYNKYTWYDMAEQDNDTCGKNWRIKVLTKACDSTENDTIENNSDNNNVVENNLGLVLSTTVNYDYDNYKVVLTPQVTGNVGTKVYNYIIKDQNNITVHEKNGVTDSNYYWKPSVGGTYTVYCTVSDNYNQKSTYKKVIVPILNNAKMSATTQFTNNKMMLNIDASSSNGAGVTQYCYEIKNAYGTSIASRCYTVQKQYSYQITAAGTYTVYCTVKDSLGKTFKLSQNITVSGITSYTMSVTTKKVSNRPVISVNASSAGGYGTKQYYYRIKKANGTVVAVRNYSTAASYDWYPTSGGVYYVEGYVLDALGSVKNKSASCTIGTFSMNGLSIRTANVSNGLRLQASSTVANPIGNVSYYYQIKNSKGAVMTTRNYSASASCEWYPKKADTYYIISYAKDSQGNTVTKQTSYKVTKATVKIKKISYSKKKSGKKYKVTIKPSASGGYGTKSYQYQILNSKGKVMTKKNYTTATKATLNVSKKGTYYIRVYAKDKWGTKVSKKVKVKI